MQDLRAAVDTLSGSCNLLFTICSHSFAVQKYITMCFNLLKTRLLPLRPMFEVQSKAFKQKTFG